MKEVFVIMIQRGWEWDDWDSSYEVFDNKFFTTKESAEEFGKERLDRDIDDWNHRDWYVEKLQQYETKHNK